MAIDPAGWRTGLIADDLTMQQIVLCYIVPAVFIEWSDIFSVIIDINQSFTEYVQKCDNDWRITDENIRNLPNKVRGHSSNKQTADAISSLQA